MVVCHDSDFIRVRIEHNAAARTFPLIGNRERTNILRLSGELRGDADNRRLYCFDNIHGGKAWAGRGYLLHHRGRFCRGIMGIEIIPHCAIAHTCACPARNADNQACCNKASPAFLFFRGFFDLLFIVIFLYRGAYEVFACGSIRRCAFRGNRRVFGGFSRCFGLFRKTRWLRCTFCSFVCVLFRVFCGGGFLRFRKGNFFCCLGRGVSGYLFLRMRCRFLRCGVLLSFPVFIINIIIWVKHNDSLQFSQFLFFMMKVYLLYVKEL